MLDVGLCSVVYEPLILIYDFLTLSIALDYVHLMELQLLNEELRKDAERNDSDLV
jgi:hypothetical protein